MEVAVGREQSIAGKADQVPEVGGAIEEVGGMGDGDVVIGVRPEREDGVGMKEPQREDGPEALIGLEQQGEGVIRKAAGASERGTGLARRERDGGRALVEEDLDEDDERVVRAKRCGAGERHGSWAEA